MAGKPAITKEEILDVAYARAREEGLGALSIRAVARDCGVAVGTLYNYFPDKASLVSAIVLKFWGYVVDACGVEPRPDECLIDYCRRLSADLERALAGFQTSWLREISMLDDQTLQLVREDEGNCLQALYACIGEAVAGDIRIRPQALAELDVRMLARFIWRVTFDTLRSGAPVYEEFLKLLSLALY
jgi:AcrR family transcriptional regulator